MVANQIKEKKRKVKAEKREESSGPSRGGSLVRAPSRPVPGRWPWGRERGLDHHGPALQRSVWRKPFGEFSGSGGSCPEGLVGRRW